MKSILHEKNGTCYLCMLLHDDYSEKVTEEHHVFPGKNRQVSEELGLKVYLCHRHHQYSDEAVHSNKDLMRMLQAQAQEKYEETHSHKEWMERIGRNYL